VSGNTYTNVFSGNSIAPANPSYLAVALTSTVVFVWPLESGEGVPWLAAVVDVTPTSAGLFVVLPPNVDGSLGAQTIMTNVGAFDFSIYDSTGVLVATLAPSQSWLMVLIDNSTSGGNGTGPDTVGEFNAEFLAWFATLPTSLPPAAGIPWNNSGSVNVSQP
jgi:hypothetical protein